MSVMFLMFAAILSASDSADPSAGAARLRISEAGQVLLDGKPWRGAGINYFDAFSRRLLDPGDTSYEAGFDELADYGIPFIRFMCGGFYPRDWQLYIDDKNAYFAVLDEFVAAAEKKNIGLIPSVFWWYPCMSDLAGEPVDQLGNPESKTMAFIRQYTEDLVSRYKDQPAIWAWELGNEYNLAADLPNAMDNLPFVNPPRGTPEKRTERDIVSSAMMLEVMKVFGERVRKFDPARPITSGHAILRASQYHQRVEGSWKSDSIEQYQQEILYTHPEPYNLISTHIYPEARKGYLGLEDCTYEKHLEIYMKAAASAGKALFLGEFGPGNIEKQEGVDAARREFDAVIQAIETSGIALSALWVYDFSWQDDFCNVTSTNHRAYQLEAIRELNKRYRNKME